MSRFSLINNIDDQHKKEAAKDPNAPNITYQRYDLDINGHEQGVLIPVRECENFETRVSSMAHLSSQKLKEIVREFRGLIVREDQ
jgi:hypothetical protein